MQPQPRLHSVADAGEITNTRPVGFRDLLERLFAQLARVQYVVLLVGAG
jgi:hypothetical protein